MKNLIIILLFLVTKNFSQDANSGNLQDRKEKIKALKVAVISQKIDLTSAEAEKFWPIFNKYEDLITNLRIEKIKSINKSKNATEEEALKLIEKNEKLEAEITALKKKLRSELIPVIGAARVIKLEQLEQNFKEKILEKLKNRKEKRNKE